MLRADPEENVTSTCHQITMEKYKLVKLQKKKMEIELASTTTLVK